jgi:hypothetical protein
MSIHSICRYLYILTISLLVCCSYGGAYAQATTVADSTAADTTSDRPERKKFAVGHQLSVGIDVFHPAMNYVYTDRYSYEMMADYYLKNEYYAVAEGGWGGCTADYSDLKYTTNNSFLRLGFNKSVLQRDNARDWDMMLMGLRVAAAGVNRSGAAYIITDSLWGNSNGTSSSKSFGVVWLELTGGVRVELVKGLCAGWNIRGKFLMNGKSFNDLAPLYIAGYGKGDKNSIFDFNMYLSYAVRWKRKEAPKPVEQKALPAPTREPVVPQPKPRMTDKKDEK